MSTFIVNVVYALGLFSSVFLVFCWGEMAGIARGSDKTALGGLFVVPLFASMRWTGLAVVLAYAVWRGAFPGLPGGRWGQFAIVLGLHLALGIVSYSGFEWVTAGLMKDDMAPQRLAWFYGIILPLPALLIGFWGVNRGFVERHSRLTVVGGIVIIALHALIFRAQVRDMRESNARRTGAVAQ